MERLLIDVRSTDGGYCASCERIPLWVVGFSGGYCEFKGYVMESIEFWLEGVRADGVEHDPIFDGEYELEFRGDSDGSA